MWEICAAQPCWHQMEFWHSAYYMVCLGGLLEGVCRAIVKKGSVLPSVQCPDVQSSPCLTSQVI